MPRRALLLAAGQRSRSAATPSALSRPRTIVVSRGPQRPRFPENARIVTSASVDAEVVSSPVVFDAVGPSSAGATAVDLTTASWSHTCSGSNRLLIVGVAAGLSPDTSLSTDVTYNGVSMTSVGQVHSNNGTDGYVQLFQLVAPATGANTVVVTASALSDISAGSVSFSSVNQTTPLGTAATAFGSGASASVAVTGTTTGNIVIDAVCTGAGVTSSTQTLRWLRNTAPSNAAGNGASATAAGTGGSVTMGYTVTSDWWGIVAVEVRQA